MNTDSVGAGGGGGGGGGGVNQFVDHPAKQTEVTKIAPPPPPPLCRNGGQQGSVHARTGWLV